MARYVDAFDLPLPQEAAFDYLAAFDHAAEWDPGVVEARRLDPEAPLGVGSRFEVVTSFLARRTPFVYEITAYEPPHRVVLRGTGGDLVSTDVIAFAPTPGGTRVSYDANLALAGVARLADPLLGLAFQWIGARAVRGLRERAAAIARRARRGERRAAAATGLARPG